MKILKETKELLIFGVKLVEEIYDITKDDNVGAMEVFQSAFSLFRVGKDGIEGLQLIGLELQDATDAQRNDLKIWFANEFDIPNDKVEPLIELAMNTAIDLLHGAYMFKKLRNENTKGFDSGDIDRALLYLELIKNEAI